MESLAVKSTSCQVDSYERWRCEPLPASRGEFISTQSRSKWKTVEETMKPHRSAISSFCSAIFWLVAVGAVVFGNVTNSDCQQIGVTSPDRGLYPAGSYALSDMETISTKNGNLIMHLPLVSLPPGRGGLSGKIGLFYNTKLWEAYSTTVPDQDGNPATVEYLRQSPDGGWNYGLNYSLTLLNLNDYRQSSGNCYSCQGLTCTIYNDEYHIYKLQVNLPDGSTHVFHSLSYPELSGYSRM